MSKHGSIMCHSFSNTIFMHVNEYLHILLAVWYHVNFLEWSTVESFFHSLEGGGANVCDPVGNWFVALQCKTIHFFVKLLWGRKFIGIRVINQDWTPTNNDESTVKIKIKAYSNI